MRIREALASIETLGLFVAFFCKWLWMNTFISWNVSTTKQHIKVWNIHCVTRNNLAGILGSSSKNWSVHNSTVRTWRVSTPANKKSRYYERRLQWNDNWNHEMNNCQCSLLKGISSQLKMNVWRRQPTRQRCDSMTWKQHQLSWKGWSNS